MNHVATDVTPTSEYHDAASVPALDWLVRVDRSDLSMRVNGAPCTVVGTRTAFVSGVVTATRSSAPNRFSPLPPAEVVESLSSTDDDGIDALRGQFVIAIADHAASTVLLVRDPVGSHPLFYVETPQAYYFAAHPHILLRQPGVSPTLNRAALADHLCMRLVQCTETFFEHIRRVPAATRVRVSQRGLDTRRYWHPLDPSRAADLSLDDEIDRFSDLLDQAVGRAIAGGRVGIFLSGGFDSVSVAAAACDVESRQNRPAPLALSVSFPDPDCGEQDVQTSVASRLGMPLTMIDFYEATGPRGLLLEGLELNARLPAPLLNTWFPAYLTLRDRGIDRGVDTVLTGEGGDEWLGVSPFLAADLLRRGDIAGLVHLIRTWKRSYRHTWASVVRATIFRFGLRPLAGQLFHRLAPTAWDSRRARRVVDARPPWISSERALRSSQYDRAYQGLAAARPVDGFYAREAQNGVEHPLPLWLFEEHYALSAPRGVRFAHPYWDADLLSHVYNVPPERLHEGDRTKALVRQTVDRRFPGLGFRRQRKVTATNFFVNLVKREAPPLAESVADFRGLAALDIVQPARARDFLAAAWNAGSPRDVGMAWNLVNVEDWVRRQLGRQ